MRRGFEDIDRAVKDECIQIAREKHRKTSGTAYRKIQAEGLLTPARQEVYHEVYVSIDYPPTSAEIGKRLYRRLQHTRLTELRDIGVIEEGPERECTVTGHKVLTWVVTGRLPEALKSKPKRVKQPSQEDLGWAIDCLGGSEIAHPDVIEWLEYRQNMSK